MVVDFNTNRSILSPTSQGTYDILFNPNGSVLGSAATNNQIILWVGDGNSGIPTSPANATLIGITCRTGFISAYPIAPVPPYTTYYDLTKDPRATGM